MNKISTIFATLVLLLSFSASSFALSMDQAKSQGLIGENSSGYLASVKAKPSAAVTAVINSINAKRKAAYLKTAASAGVSISVVEKRVAQRLSSKAAKGAFLRNASGVWYRK